MHKLRWVGVLVIVGCAAGAARCACSSAHVTDGALAGPPRFVGLVAGAEHACALHGSGRVACFGHAALAGDDTTAHWVPGAERSVEVAAGLDNGCLRQPEGKVYCWGFRVPPRDLAEAGGLTERPLLLTQATHVLDDIRLLGGSQYDPSMVSTSHRRIAVVASSSVWSSLLPRSLDARFMSRVEAVTMGTVDPDVVQYTESSEASCQRHADGRAECDSSGLTGADGKPFASLEAPKRLVRTIGASWFQTCFVLDDGVVECRSTRGVLDPELPFVAEVAYADSSQVCALHEGTVTCREFRFDSNAPLQIGPLIDVVRGARALAAMSFQMCALHGQSEDQISCWGRGAAPHSIALPAPRPASE